jgi:Mn2+/Fe2+ NRAMP family transporter
MFAVVYLSSKIGLVSGQGLLAVIREHYPRWLLYLVLAGVMLGNTIEAGADIGGMAAALNLIVPIHPVWIVIGITAVTLALQLWGSYTMIRSIFRWLALALLAYLGSAILARPEIWPVLRGTFIPAIQLNHQFLEMVVAIIGTSLSAYLSWQSNQDVEENISMGRRRLDDRRGTTKAELTHSAGDILLGMVFLQPGYVLHYFIDRRHSVPNREDRCSYSGAGRPSLATACRKRGWPAVRDRSDRGGIYRSPRHDRWCCLRLLSDVWVETWPAPSTGAIKEVLSYNRDRHPGGHEHELSWLNPIRALVWAGVVQGFSTPFLLVAAMFITNNRSIMGQWVNTRALNVLGWITTIAIFAATVGLVVSWAI